MMQFQRCGCFYGRHRCNEVQQHMPQAPTVAAQGSVSALLRSGLKGTAHYLRL